MKGFRKQDEMGKSINLRAMRVAWLYSSVFLLVWVGYDWIKNGTFNNLAFILMMSQAVVFWASNILLSWKLGKDEK